MSALPSAGQTGDLQRWVGAILWFPQKPVMSCGIPPTLQQTHFVIVPNFNWELPIMTTCDDAEETKTSHDDLENLLCCLLVEL